VAGTWANQQMMCVNFWLVGKVPRGPATRCHVAPFYWLFGFNVKYGLACTGVEPATSPPVLD
jgi:hypothetical protein